MFSPQSDATTILEKDMDYRNEHLDFIQMHLRYCLFALLLVSCFLLLLCALSCRKACLRYGASLVYNGKDGKTRDSVTKYIFHRAYGFPFAGKANIAERDGIFVPSGALLDGIDLQAGTGTRRSRCFMQA